MLDRIPSSLRAPFLRAMVSVLVSVYTRLKVEGSNNIPEEPVLYICNHLSNVDALILAKVLRKNPPVFMAGVKLLNTTMTRLVMDLVDVLMIEPNSADIDALRNAIQTLQSGRSVLIFPEGGRSRAGSLLRAKAGAPLIARRAGVKIVPVSLMGTENLLPIDDSNMGGEKLRMARVTVRIGPAFSIPDVTVTGENGKEDRQATADHMMKRVALLLSPEYRGFYAD